MQYTKSTNTDLNKAQYGENSAGVLALQKDLNTKYGGQAGYTPLKEDGLYGDLTKGAVAGIGTKYGITPTPTTATNTATAPTIESVYNIPTLQQDPSLTEAQSKAEQFYKNQIAGTPNVDEQGIRTKTLAEFQAEIDAVNSLYLNKLNEAKLAGAGRLGSNTAIQSRRGLIGSDFGASETSTVNKGNEEVYAGIEAEKGAKIAAILSGARTKADETIAARNKAIADGLDAHISYLKDSGERKKTNATLAAQFIYNQSLSPSDLTEKELADTATGYGVSTKDILAAFGEVKKTGDAEEEAKKLEQQKVAKAGLTVVPAGSVIIDVNGNIVGEGNAKTEKVSTNQEVYQRNPDGTYTKVITGPVKATGGGGGSVPQGSVKSGKAIFTPTQMSDFSSALETSKGPDNYVDPDAYLDAYKAWTDPEVGGLAKDFLLKFPPKKYVNPANNKLPEYLRSNTSKASGSTSAGDI